MTGTQQLWMTVLLAFVTGSVPTVILFLLNKRGANKKLNIEEGSLSVTQFNAQTAVYQDLLDRADAATKGAEKALASVRQERSDLRHQLEDHEDRLSQLRDLFRQYIARTGVPLTEEELHILEDTKPVRRR